MRQQGAALGSIPFGLREHIRTATDVSVCCGDYLPAGAGASFMALDQPEAMENAEVVLDCLAGDSKPGGEG